MGWRFNPFSGLFDHVPSSAGGGAVSSVAGRTGAVTLAGNDVGLGNVNNTADADKPISTAAQTALNLKAPLASPALTGAPTVPTAPPGTNTTQAASTAFVGAAVAGSGGSVDGVAINPASIGATTPGPITGTMLLAGAGTASAPSFAFAAYPGVGIGFAYPGQASLLTGGGDIATWYSGGMRLHSAVNFGWSSGSSALSGLDAYFSHPATGMVVLTGSLTVSGTVSGDRRSRTVSGTATFIVSASGGTPRDEVLFVDTTTASANITIPLLGVPVGQTRRITILDGGDGVGAGDNPISIYIADLSFTYTIYTGGGGLNIFAIGTAGGTVIRMYPLIPM